MLETVRGAVSELLPVVVHTTIIYLSVVAFIALFGRRQTSEIGALELVVIMLLGSAVETAMVAGDTSLQAGLAAAFTLLLLNRIISLLLHRSRSLRRLMRGEPVPLVYKGHFLPFHMHRVELTEDDVRQGMREQGYESVEQVRLAMLELDGTISVVPMEG